MSVVRGQHNASIASLVGILYRLGRSLAGNAGHLEVRARQRECAGTLYCMSLLPVTRCKEDEE